MAFDLNASGPIDAPCLTQVYGGNQTKTLNPNVEYRARNFE